METIHTTNINFLKKYISKSSFDWINYNIPIGISYFKSGWWTNLYLIKNWDKKFLARINFFPGKNDWKVKRGEFEILQEIEHLNISPKVYVLNEDNELKQDFTIVEYIEGENITEFWESEIRLLAKDFKKLHAFPKTYNTKEELPYKCSIYDEFANGEDKKIETYDFKNIHQVVEKYNSIKKELGEWFNTLPIFATCKNVCLCHGDLKAENILKTEKWMMLIDWECADIDIPETDIGRLFSGCTFTKEQQNIFLHEYYGKIPSDEILKRIWSIKIVVDFFRIIENYCIHKRKEFNTIAMINDLEKYEKELNQLKIEI